MRNQHYNSSEKPGARAGNLCRSDGASNLRLYPWKLRPRRTGEDARAYIGRASSAAGNHWMVTSGGFLNAVVAI
jgi:hypothetical protein